MRVMNFKYDTVKKVYYADGHEKDERREVPPESLHPSIGLVVAVYATMASY